jgi:hypothetical protein
VDKFAQNYLMPISQAHLNIVVQKQNGQFVGTKTLHSTLKYISTALRNKKVRELVSPHFQTILFNICLPSILLDEGDMECWEMN